MKPLKVVEPLVVWDARRDSGGRRTWPEAWVSGFGETMYYKGVAEGEDTEGMMILFGPGEMQLFTEKKPLEI